VSKPNQVTFACDSIHEVGVVVFDEVFTELVDGIIGQVHL